jgi:riboflavin synthase
MFTGIIEATGVLKKLEAKGGDLRVTIQSDSLDFSDVKLGDSIASNGVCLTVTAQGADWFSADLSAETLKRSLFGHYKQGQRINLEKALLPTTRLGGHLVSGHVDGVTTISKIQAEGRAWQVYVKAPDELARYLAEKGSVTIDGISLTINELTAEDFRLTIVPHTALETTMSNWRVGSAVHIEVDLIARYLERLLRPTDDKQKAGISLSLLQQSGFL